MTFRPPALSLFRHFRAIKCRQMAHCMKQHQQQLLFYFPSPHNPAGTLSPLRPSPVATCTFKDIASPPPSPRIVRSMCISHPAADPRPPVRPRWRRRRRRRRRPWMRRSPPPRQRGSPGKRPGEKWVLFFERIDWLQESLGKVEEAQIAPVSCCVGLLIWQ